MKYSIKDQFEAAVSVIQNLPKNGMNFVLNDKVYEVNCSRFIFSNIHRASASSLIAILKIFYKVFEKKVH